MAFVVADRVKETSTTTGTGTFTLAGAVTGFQSFAAVGNGNTTYYCIASQSANEWEVGLGTYTSAGTTLARTTVLSSSNAGSLVNFSAGTKDVFVTYPSGYSVYSDGTRASGTWGISISGNAATATSATSATTATTATNWGSYGAVPAAGTSFGNANTIGRSDASGYTYFNYINSNTSNNENPTVSQVIVTNGSDNFYRKSSISSFTSAVQSNASGTWGINISGNAATASSASSVAWGNVTSKPAYIMYYQGFTLDANTMDSNATGFTYSVNAPYTGPIARFSTGGSYDLWLNAPYSSGGYGLAFRTRNGDTGTLNSWQYPAVYNINANGGGALYATIYYDQDNTGYYVNPNGTSQLSYVLADNWFRAQGNTGFYFESYARGIVAPETAGNNYGNVATYGSGRNGWLGYGIGSRWVLMSTGGDNVGIHDNSNTWLYYWNGSYHQFNRDYAVFTSSARAPIFYDSDNTGYYADPASTSNLNGLTVAATISGSISGSSASSNALNNVGYGNGNHTWYQTSSNFQTWTGGWASHLISNHGDGSTYYNQILIMPFWGPPQYMRKEGGTNTGPWVFLTTENYTSYVPTTTGGGASGTWSINVTGSAGSATTATTATNIAGGAANRIPYQTGAGATSFITAPSVSSTYLQWNGSAFTWAAAGGGAAAGGAVYENTQTISSNYTMTTNYNGVSAGPITISTGVTVTIPTGSSWSIV